MYQHNLKDYNDSKMRQSKVDTRKVSVFDCLFLWNVSSYDLFLIIENINAANIFRKTFLHKAIFLYLWRVISLIRLLADIVLEAFGFIPFVVNLGNSTYNRNGRETLPLGRHICTLTYKYQGSEPFPSSIIRALRVKAYHKG